MEEEQFDKIKHVVLSHVEKVFEEMEEEMAVSHQEKYALLEDAFESASDSEELFVAFQQWYNDHSEDLDFGNKVEELWDHALSNLED